MRFLPNIIKNRPRKKWSAERIRERFDADAEQFAALAEGQKEVVDAKVMRDLVAKAAAATTPHAQAALDVGCGGGFYAQGIIAELPGIRLTLTDISREMLDNAAKQLAPRMF